MKHTYIIFRLCAVVIIACTSSTQAQNIIRPKITGPNGLYVNSYNGVLFFERTDLATRNSMMPMELNFYYNSSACQTNVGFGLGFSIGFGMSLEVDTVGGVTVLSGDGRPDYYTRYGAEYQAPAGVFSALTQPEEDQYLLVEKTGERYEFYDTLYHHITAMEDRFGNRTEYTYTDSLLTQISDAAGHVITLTYTNGMLTRADASFTPGAYQYTYDEQKRLRSITAPDGAVTQYGYDKRNQLCRITDPMGNITSIVYNNSNMVSRLKTAVSDKSIRYEKDKTVFIDYTQPKNQYSYYLWDDKGRVIEKTGLCCGMQSQLEYDEDDNVISRTDANNHTTRYTYDDRGNMLSMTDPLGHTEQYTYTTDFNLPATYTDKNGNTYRFSYDSHGSMIRIAGPLGLTATFEYDSHGWQTSATDAMGNRTTTAYNEDGTTASVTDPKGNTVRFEYDHYGNITSYTDALSHKTRYTYDQMNRLTMQMDALNYTTSVSYDKAGRVVRVRDGQNRISAFTYDVIGHVVTQTNPAGGSFTYTYDGKGNVLTATDPIGTVNTFSYNDLNKLLSQTNGEGETTSYEYDVKGNLTAVFQANGNTISYTYDALDRIVQLADNLGTIAVYTYDANGNQLSVTDAMGRTMTSSFDALNRLISRTMPSGAVTQYTYDLNSNLLSIQDAMQHVTQYAYNELNRQICHTDALNALTSFEYDANGNLIRTTDAKGNATKYAYDILNRNTVITFANGQSLQYTYDELGRVIAFTDRAGQTSRYTYDALGNLLAKTYPDGTADRYSYDAVSRMLTAVNRNASVSFLYDRANRLLSETLNGQQISYAYDIANNNRTMTYPSGMVVSEQLNPRGLITSILQNGTEAVAMTYNAAGQKSSQTYANGITTNYAYNENGWLQSIQASNNIMNLQYAYDAIGNITSRTDLLDNNRSETYAYDAIGQLISFARGGNTTTFEFDQLGNRIRTLQNGIQTDYATNNVNAYVSVSGLLSFTPQYDANGNLLTDGTHTYSYDFNNRLVEIDNGTTSTYKYDALGRRMAKDSTLFYYAGDQMVEEVTNGITASYLYGNNINEAIQMRRGDSVWYYHTNHLGSVMAISNASGSMVERMEYDAYGMPSFFDANGQVIMQSQIGNTILFTGREYDYASETYYYRARSMQPALGRFMQHDPLGYVDGMNDYSYVRNRAILMVDPLGLQQKSCDDNNSCKASEKKFNNSCNYCGADNDMRFSNFGDVKFNRACYNHDRCYAFKTPKYLCDMQFYYDMKHSSIGQKFPIIPYIYANAVGFRGHEAYGAEYNDDEAKYTFNQSSQDLNVNPWARVTSMLGIGYSIYSNMPFIAEKYLPIIASNAISVAENAWFSLSGGLGSVVSALDFWKNEEKQNPGVTKTVVEGWQNVRKKKEMGVVEYYEAKALGNL